MGGILYEEGSTVVRALVSLNLRVARARVAVTRLWALGLKAVVWSIRRQGPRDSNESRMEEDAVAEVAETKDAGVAGVVGVAGVLGTLVGVLGVRGQRRPMVPSKTEAIDAFLGRLQTLRH